MFFFKHTLEREETGNIFFFSKTTMGSQTSICISPHQAILKKYVTRTGRGGALFSHVHSPYQHPAVAAFLAESLPARFGRFSSALCRLVWRLPNSDRIEVGSLEDVISRVDSHSHRYKKSRRGLVVSKRLIIYFLVSAINRSNLILFLYTLRLCPQTVVFIL